MAMINRRVQRQRHGGRRTIGRHHSPNDRPADANPHPRHAAPPTPGWRLAAASLQSPRRPLAWPTSSRAGAPARRWSAWGCGSRDAKQVLTDAQSAEQKAADAQVQQADGFLPRWAPWCATPARS